MFLNISNVLPLHLMPEILSCDNRISPQRDQWSLFDQISSYHRCSVSAEALVCRLQRTLSIINCCDHQHTRKRIHEDPRNLNPSWRSVLDHNPLDFWSLTFRFHNTEVVIRNSVFFLFLFCRHFGDKNQPLSQRPLLASQRGPCYLCSGTARVSASGSGVVIIWGMFRVRPFTTFWSTSSTVSSGASATPLLRLSEDQTRKQRLDFRYCRPGRRCHQSASFPETPSERIWRTLIWFLRKLLHFLCFFKRSPQVTKVISLPSNQQAAVSRGVSMLFTCEVCSCQEAETHSAGTAQILGSNSRLRSCSELSDSAPWSLLLWSELDGRRNRKTFSLWGFWKSRKEMKP